MAELFTIVGLQYALIMGMKNSLEFTKVTFREFGYIAFVWERDKKENKYKEIRDVCDGAVLELC